MSQFYLIGVFTSVILVLSNGNPVSENSIAYDNVGDQKNICLEKECINIADALLNNIDSTVDPCDDFYKFACGQYATRNPIPEDKSDVSSITIIKDLVQLQLKQVLEEPSTPEEPEHFKKLKLYYNSCINLETVEKHGLTPMKEIISSVGGWPAVEDKDPIRDWQSVLYGLRNEKLESSSLFKQYVDADYLNSSVRVIAVDPPNFFNIKQDILIQGKEEKNVKAYYTYMKEIAVLFGAKKDVAEKDMDQVLDFEITIARESKTLEQKRQNFTELYNLYTIQEMKEVFPKFPWTAYMKAFTPENFTLSEEQKFIVTEPKYVNKLIELLETTPDRVLINYLIWRAVSESVPYLNQEIRDLEQNLSTVLMGSSKRKDRYKECIDEIQDSLLPLVSSLYVRKFFNMHSRDVASEMVKYLKDEFKKILNETNWSAGDKEKAIDKVESLNEFTGFPNELLDDNKLDEQYGKLEVTEGNFLKTKLLAERYNEKFAYSRLHLPVNKTDWIDYSNSAVVNAYYLPTTNSIIFPAAILQGVYFHADRPKYVNFATIGSVIGHEMSHGFDEVGHQFDKNGDLKNWWSEEANADFQEKKKCIIDQFDSYTIPDGTHLKGSLTVGENLADFGGQKMGYLSYHEWEAANGEEPGLPGLNYTNKQIYWIAGASIWCNNEREASVKFKIDTDPHPPNPFRVNGPLKNFEMFSKDYNCPVGSNMNPVKKCNPW